MTLTLPADHVDKLVGGVAAADESIRASLPSQLEYSGLQVSAGGALSATLTMRFTSPADYVVKARALLALDSDFVTPPTFTVSDSTLVRGVVINESYTSASLLQWLFAALKKDGVLGGSTSTTNAYEVGSTELRYGQAVIPQTGGAIRADLVDNAGFAAVSMSTDVSEADIVRRTITYVAAPGSDTARYEQFFTTATPEGAGLQRNGLQWVMTFTGTAKQVATATDTALGSSGTVLEVGRAQNKATLTLTVRDTASCASVCARSASPLTDELRAPSQFSTAPLTIDTAGTDPIALEFVPEFDAIAQQLDIGLFGTTTATTKFTVSTSTAELLGNGFEQLLAPPDGVGALSKSVEGDATSFTVTIAASASEFDRAYSSWASAGGLRTEDLPGSTVLGATTTYDFESGLQSVIGAHGVTLTMPTAVSLPLGKWVSAGSTDAASPGGRVSFQSQGLTAVGLITVAVSALLLATATYLFVRVAGRRASRSRQPLTASPVSRGPVGSLLLGGDFPRAQVSVAPTVFDMTVSPKSGSGHGGLLAWTAPVRRPHVAARVLQHATPSTPHQQPSLIPRE
ncbi:hypothetical protein [Microbacterium sp. CJ88]|uniref:hypothetical protein n=1 Tax=Microbacterium sp. CJ88 TaxID=3445672 RepID=UPI003F658235